MPSDADFVALTEKVDALIKALTPPETPKEDARDKSLAKGINFFKTYLANALPKEKLDALTFDELVLAAELKGHTPPALNPAPAPKNDAKPGVPDWMAVEVV